MSPGLPIRVAVFPLQLAMRCRTELVYVTSPLEDPGSSDSIPSPRCKPHDHHSHCKSYFWVSTFERRVSCYTLPNPAPPYPMSRASSSNPRSRPNSVPFLKFRSRHCLLSCGAGRHGISTHSRSLIRGFFIGIAQSPSHLIRRTDARSQALTSRTRTCMDGRRAR